MRITFNNLPDFLFNEHQLLEWLSHCADIYGFYLGKIMYSFIDEDEMYRINNQHLNHNTDTDIITFDYSTDNTLCADIYISLPRLIENATENNQTNNKEALRLMSHGLLHCLGYADKTHEEKKIMRSKENEWMELFHVKH